VGVWRINIEKPELRLRFFNKKHPVAFATGCVPQMPCRPNYNLHVKAGGSPKFCFAASNVRRNAGRPAIRRFKSASLIRDVGLMGRETLKRRHAHSRNFFSFYADNEVLAGTVKYMPIL